MLRINLEMRARYILLNTY